MGLIGEDLSSFREIDALSHAERSVDWLYILSKESEEECGGGRQPIMLMAAGVGLVLSGGRAYSEGFRMPV